MSSIYYLNSRNEKIDFIDDFHLVDMTDLFSGVFTAETDNDMITAYKRGVTNYTIQGDGPVSNFEKITDVFDYDIYRNERGRLYVGEYFMYCNILGISASDIKLKRTYFQATLTITTDMPYWIREIKYTFEAAEANESSLTYPYEYPFNYGKSIGVGTIMNEAIRKSDFKMIIYGPVNEPSIMIGYNTYAVKTDVDSQEYITIESKIRKTCKISNTGAKENMFNNRGLENSIFEKIEPGMNAVNWSGSFGFDLFIYEERSRPKWISSIQIVT